MAQKSKRDHIIETAGDLFIRYGYTKVSMDQIAAAVPVSKPTLYAHFADKAALFSVIIEHRCQNMVQAIKAEADSGKDVKVALTEIATYFLDIALSKGAIAMHRVILGESVAFPETARCFYEAGPKRMHAVLGDYFAELDRQGKLSVPDPLLSADMFLGMIKGGMHLKLMMNMIKKPSARDIAARVDYAVALFIKAHKR